MPMVLASTVATEPVRSCRLTTAPTTMISSRFETAFVSRSIVIAAPFVYPDGSAAVDLVEDPIEQAVGPVLERVEQGLPVRVAAVERPHADPRLRGDGRERDVAAFPQHRGDGGGQDALAVQLGVAPGTATRPGSYHVSSRSWRIWASAIS